MNAEAGEITSKDLHRFPSWPPLHPALLKGSLLENKVGDFFFFSERTHKARTDVTRVTSTLCIPQRKTTRTSAGDLAAGQREGQLECRPLMTGSPQLTPFTSRRECRWRKGAVSPRCKQRWRICKKLLCSSLVPTSGCPAALADPFKCLEGGTRRSAAGLGTR